MTEPESMTQTRGKTEKQKPYSNAASRKRRQKRRLDNGRTRAGVRQRIHVGRTSSEQDPHVIARIQQRAYWLCEASGFEEGRALEHWLEAGAG